MDKIVQRWEWRTFAGSVPTADAVFDAMESTVESSEELYLLTPAGDNVKVRDGLMDVKVLRETAASGLQRWEPILKAPFPLDEEAVSTVFEALRRPPPDESTADLSLEAVLTAAGAGTPSGPRALSVRKTRARYSFAGCQAERSVFEVDGRRTTSIAAESTDPAAVVAVVDALGLSAYLNLDVRTGLRLIVDEVPERYAVIDAGTNSTKFHVAEVDPDTGAWRTVVDRAVVTRLGEGLEDTGAIGEEPLERTARAIGEMAEEARGLDVRAIVAVGTAGVRIASNQAEVLDRLRATVGTHARGDLGRGRGPARLPGRGDRYRAARRGDRRLRHRRRKLAVHVRSR